MVDFAVFWADGRVTFEDTKGMETEAFKIKKREVEALYGVNIDVIGEVPVYLPPNAEVQ